MAQQPRDWDKELAKIDRLISAQGEAPARAPAQGAALARPPSALPAAATEGRRAWLGTWGRVLLGVAVGIGVTQWPYARACGTMLFVYLGAVGVVVLAGLWGAISSWRRRLGLAHLVSLGIVVWGLALVVREVLPRVGYAKVAATWICP